MADEQLLIIDDKPENLKLARVLLQIEGFVVRTATDAEEALRILETYRPRLILMDIQLPGMDGLQLTRKLKADPATRDILIIAVTAYAMKGDDQKTVEAGCDGYVSKPINTRTLPGLIRTLLNAKPAKEPS